MGGELVQSIDSEGEPRTVTKDDFECPLGWEWSGAWLVDNTKGDPEGLCTAWIVINPFGVHNDPFGVHCYLGDMLKTQLYTVLLASIVAQNIRV